MLSLCVRSQKYTDFPPRADISATKIHMTFRQMRRGVRRRNIQCEITQNKDPATPDDGRDPVWRGL